MARLLVLGAGPAQLGVLAAARAAELTVVAADRDPSAPGFRYADPAGGGGSGAGVNPRRARPRLRRRPRRVPRRLLPRGRARRRPGRDGERVLRAWALCAVDGHRPRAGSAARLRRAARAPLARRA